MQQALAAIEKIVNRIHNKPQLASVGLADCHRTQQLNQLLAQCFGLQWLVQQRHTTGLRLAQPLGRGVAGNQQRWQVLTQFATCTIQLA